MKNKFFPGNISQSCIFILFFILVAGSFSWLLAKIIGNDQLLLHIYFSTGSAIIILLAHWKNRSSKERIKYDFRIVKPLILIPLLFVPVIYHLTLFPVFRGLIIDEYTPNSMASLDKIIGFVILAPVYEEIIFRNIVLRGLLTRYSGHKSIAISAVLFALFHIDVVNIYWGKIITALLLGLFLGWLFYKTGRIGLCILLHSFSNLIVIASFSLKNYLQTNFPPDFFPMNVYWLMIIFSTILIVYLLLYINKKIIFLNKT
jgi:membrane protease YdiL (CAAX protease family)